MSEIGSQDFVQEAERIIEYAAKRGITLRVMGACAIMLHCPRCGYLYQEMNRSLSDIDLMSYGKFNPMIKSLFKELGYSPHERFNVLYGHKRQLYFNNTSSIKADVFFERLEMCHTIDFKGRLELDYPTITLSDILLEKVQIVRINEKDIKDTIIMLREHDIGESEKETVNSRHIAKLMSNDWGFYYTATTNLNKVKTFLNQFSVLTEEDRKDVALKIDKLLQVIENEPKSLKWKMRAKIGTSKKWYVDVEEIVRETEE